METKTLEAVMHLPKNGRKDWTELMYGNVIPSENIALHEVVVSATATFPDGIKAVGGVKKYTEYCYKFFDIYDAQGKLFEPAPIDVSDNEDFMQKGYFFNINEDESIEYHLIIEEES
ncbi:MAG: hypothetical protein K1X72_25225 [Pyrinomonadaceae bacterium]|nr:hypothetical protein [Pyrinomonadaceae bacterium]